jgi:hypothetical protein
MAKAVKAKHAAVRHRLALILEVPQIERTGYALNDVAVEYRVRSTWEHVVLGTSRRLDAASEGP